MRTPGVKDSRTISCSVRITAARQGMSRSELIAEHELRAAPVPHRRHDTGRLAPGYAIMKL
jgi:hypothetical protein